MVQNKLGRIYRKGIEPFPQKNLVVISETRSTVTRVTYVDSSRETEIFVEPFSIGSSNFVQVNDAVTGKEKTINLNFVKEYEDFEMLRVQFRDSQGNTCEYVYALEEPGLEIIFR